MFVYKLYLCDFVIWTKLGIFTDEIPFDEIIYIYIWPAVEGL